jgi:tRNA(adenine34) deaminase
MACLQSSGNEMERVSVDADYMQEALLEAEKARDFGEVPVGAVVVLDQKVIGRGCNRPITDKDPSGHAEINALRDAASNLGNYRLTGADLYVTLEPCIMCAGAILHARISRVIFGAWDEKTGAAGSRLNLLESSFLNHQTSVVSGVLEQEAGKLLQDFFRSRR